MIESPPGVDLESLTRFLDGPVGGLAGSLHGSVIPGGRSNLTYEITDGTRRWVLRRPPLAHVLPTAHDMGREWTVISALQGTGIPVPVAVAFCADAEVIGAPFYVMEFVDGHVVRDRLPAVFPPTPDTRTRMSEALVDTLVRLHAVVPDEVGLAGFGHPQGFLERQVRRWWQQWEASKIGELPSIEELRRRLERSVPEPSPAGIVHGDYRLDNVVYAPDDPGRIVAILDWEMSTIGDPLCDLGLLIVYWPDTPEDPAIRALHSGRLCTDEGFFNRDRIVEMYQATGERDCSELDWYIALGSYKLAIIAEGIAFRHRMGMTVGEGFETMGEMVPAIVEGALALASASVVPALRGD